jgi:hypothetical protein
VDPCDSTVQFTVEPDKLNVTSTHSGRNNEQKLADPSGRAVSGVDLRPFPCWDFGFEPHRGHGCLSLVNVVCFQVEISASS